MENTQKPFLSHTEKFFFFFSSSSSSPSPPFWVLLYSPEMVWCISGVSEDSRNALNATVATLSGQCAVWIGRGERERESHKELANRKFVGLPAMRAPRTMQVAQFTVAALASCGREPLAVSLSLFPLVYFALIYHRDIIPLDSIAKIPWQAAAGGIVNRPVRIPSHSPWPSNGANCCSLRQWNKRDVTHNGLSQLDSPPMKFRSHPNDGRK